MGALARLRQINEPRLRTGLGVVGAQAGVKAGETEQGSGRQEHAGDDREPRT